MRQQMRELRIKKGISQTYLAKRLGYKNASGYANIEYGFNNLSLQNALIIAEVLGVNVTDLEEKPSFFEEKLHKMCNDKKPA